MVQDFSEEICRKIEETEEAILRLTCEVREVGSALIVTNQKFPIALFNNARRVNAQDSETNNLITKVIAHYKAKGLPASFLLSPLTRPTDFSGQLVSRGFELQGEESIMIHEDRKQNLRPNYQVDVKVADERLLEPLTDVFTQGFEMPPQLRLSLLEMTKKAIKIQNNVAYLAYFHGEPVGTLSFYSTDKVSGLYGLATIDKYRRRGVATTLSLRAVTDLINLGSEVIYLGARKGSIAERLAQHLGFVDFYTRFWYTLKR